MLGLTEGDALVPWDLPYVIPIVLVAGGVGAAGGVAAGGLATALAVGQAQIMGLDLGVVGVLVRALVFLVVGWVAGAGAKGTAKVSEKEVARRVRRLADSAYVADPESSQARPRESQKLAGLGTWELDLRTGESVWSEEYRDLYGVDPRTLISDRTAFQEIVHPEDRKIVSEGLERIIRDSTTLEIRYRIIRPNDGAERCIRSHIHAQLDAAGEPVRLVGTGQDVTDLVMVLSAREREILMLLAEGLSGPEIAEKFVLSPETVRTHIRKAMVKLDARTRGQAIATALRSKEIGS